MLMMCIKCLHDVRSMMLELNSMMAKCQYLCLYSVSIYFLYISTFIVACIR